MGLLLPYNGVITHLELDILECEVKWALESITKNKASGGDEIPVELFQILKWFAIPFSSGAHSVRPLHHDPPILGGSTRHGLVSLSKTSLWSV